MGIYSGIFHQQVLQQLARATLPVLMLPKYSNVIVTRARLIHVFILTNITEISDISVAAQWVTALPMAQINVAQRAYHRTIRALLTRFQL